MSTKTQRRKATKNRIKAMSHPLRGEILRILTERTSSPAEMARELDEELSNVSYHTKQLVEFECAELVAALGAARQGDGRAALLLGEAGMGKSVMADWLVRQARTSGVRVARGACSAGGMTPLWPWQRALAQIAPQLP